MQFQINQRVQISMPGHWLHGKQARILQTHPITNTYEVYSIDGRPKDSVLYILAGHLRSLIDELSDPDRFNQGNPINANDIAFVRYLMK